MPQRNCANLGLTFQINRRATMEFNELINRQVTPELARDCAQVAEEWAKKAAGVIMTHRKEVRQKRICVSSRAVFNVCVLLRTLISSRFPLADLAYALESACVRVDRRCVICFCRLTPGSDARIHSLDSQVLPLPDSIIIALGRRIEL
jgi:hypothetical protein